MPEGKHEEHHADEKKVEEHKSRLPFKIKLTRVSIISIFILIVVVALLAIPTYLPKGNCEVARPDYKCVPFKTALIENCAYWGKYNCNTSADVSLPQIEWYIGNLCDLQNQYHNTGLDCSNLKQACNQITGTTTCPAGY